MKELWVKTLSTDSFNEPLKLLDFSVSPPVLSRPTPSGQQPARGFEDDAVVLLLVVRPTAWKRISLSPRQRVTETRPRSRVAASQVSRRRLGADLAPTFPRDGPVPLLPQRDAVAGTDAFGVLEEAGGSGDDPTGQSVAERGWGGRDAMLEARRRRVTRKRRLRPPPSTAAVDPPFPRVPGLFGEGVMSSAQVVLACVHHQRSANHIPDLQSERRLVSTWEATKEPPPLISQVGQRATRGIGGSQARKW